jgi:hypothetical protein
LALVLNVYKLLLGSWSKMFQYAIDLFWFPWTFSIGKYFVFINQMTWENRIRKQDSPFTGAVGFLQCWVG